MPHQLLVLHFEGRVSVSGTGSGRTRCVVTSTERNDVSAIVKGGRCAEGCTVECQWSTFVVEDLHANVGRAARCGTLQSQNGIVGGIYRITGKRYGRFGGNAGVAVV